MKTPNHALFPRTLMTAAALIVIATASSLHAEVIYRQNFGYTGGNPAAFNRTPLTTTGWSSLWATQGTNNVANYTDSYYIGIVNYQGAPTNLDNVGAPVSASNQYGAVRIFNNDNLKIHTLIYTEQFTIDTTEYSLDSISWYASGTSGGDNLDYFRAALRVEDQWYVSGPVNARFLTGNNPANFSASADLRGVDVDSVSWYTLTATVGSPFAIGSTAVDLPLGDITAFGLYGVPRQTNSSYLMFDSFTIEATAIPEPGSMVLLVAAGAALGLARRHRCKE